MQHLLAMLAVLGAIPGLLGVTAALGAELTFAMTFAHLPSFDFAQAIGQLATTQRDASFAARKHDPRPS